MTISNKLGTVAVVGLGYVGLPLALLARQRNWQVIGVDIDAGKVDQINRGLSPFTDRKLSTQLRQYPISATTDPATISSADIVVIAVPTPVTVDNQPDLTPLTGAISGLLPHLRDQQTIVVESTINPGVMDEVVKPLLEQRPDITIHLAHCPERINPGDSNWSVRNIPRVLGSYTDIGATKAYNFYSTVLDAPIKIMDSPTEAEAVKIMENTFRDVNIAFINEMAKSFDALGINITNVIAGAATKPFAFLPHYPGHGVGGHCISVDPYYMIERGRQAGFDHKFLKLARQINESMPAYFISLLEQALAQTGVKLTDSTIALLGVAYKPDVSDTRNSPALKILELLQQRAAKVKVYDPFSSQYSTASSLNAALANSQAVILTCAHTKFIKTLTPALLASHQLDLIIDGPNALKPEPFLAHGITYGGIGRGLLKPMVVSADRSAVPAA